MDYLPNKPDVPKLRSSTFDIKAVKLGSHILEIAVIEEGGTQLKQLLDSPILLEVSITLIHVSHSVLVC